MTFKPNCGKVDANRAPKGQRGKITKRCKLKTINSLSVLVAALFLVSTAHSQTAEQLAQQDLYGTVMHCGGSDIKAYCAEVLTDVHGWWVINRESLDDRLHIWVSKNGENGYAYRYEILGPKLVGVPYSPGLIADAEILKSSNSFTSPQPEALTKLKNLIKPPAVQKKKPVTIKLTA